MIYAYISYYIQYIFSERTAFSNYIIIYLIPIARQNAWFLQKRILNARNFDIKTKFGSYKSCKRVIPKRTRIVMRFLQENCDVFFFLSFNSTQLTSYNHKDYTYKTCRKNSVLFVATIFDQNINLIAIKQIGGYLFSIYMFMVNCQSNISALKLLCFDDDKTKLMLYA